MCNDCFSSEIIQFENLPEWNAFELALKDKLEKGTMKKVKQPDKTDSLFIHECVICKEKWVLQSLANGNDGSFLTLSTVLEKMKVSAWRRRLRIVVLAMVIVLVILEWLAG
jgi:hypothetical protein